MTKMFSYLIILFALFICTNSIAQSPCDTSEVFVVSEIMPTLKTSMEELENKINSSILLKEYKINEGQILTVRFIINCIGEVCNYRVQKYENELFNQKIIDCLKNCTDWAPGYQAGKPINSWYKLKFEVLNNKIMIEFDKKFNEKEKKKLERLNYRKKRYGS